MGNILGGRPRRGSGGGAPRTPENFQKISQENFKKWIILGDFSKKLINPELNFRDLDENPIVWEIFEKIFKDFFEKKHKNALFWSIFKIISKPGFKFPRVLTKTN